MWLDSADPAPVAALPVCEYWQPSQDSAGCAVSRAIAGPDCCTAPAGGWVAARTGGWTGAEATAKAADQGWSVQYLPVQELEAPPRLLTLSGLKPLSLMRPMVMPLMQMSPIWMQAPQWQPVRYPPALNAGPAAVGPVAAGMASAEAETTCKKISAASQSNRMKAQALVPRDSRLHRTGFTLRRSRLPGDQQHTANVDQTAQPLPAVKLLTQYAPGQYDRHHRADGR